MITVEKEAIDYIHSTPRFSRTPTLERIAAILTRLGNPQNDLKYIHIAGTNGKGSTAAMTASVLQAAGYRTGLFTSPYLEQFRERVQLNGQMISPEDLADCTQQVRDVVETLVGQGTEAPNEFELVTAIGLLWFARQKADVVVLEVGLGGRFDATNVIEAPLAAAITSISLDHTGVLGNTLAEIAWEKAGILKAGSLAVLSSGQVPEVRETVRQAATEVGALLVESDPGQLSQVTRTEQGMDFLWRGRRFHLPLLGAYQRDNVSTVLTLVELLRMQGLDLPDTAVEAGLRQVSWPGRLERMKENILLDAGHNPGGIDALCRELDTTFAGRPVVALMGMLADKAHAYCIQQVACRSQAFYAVSPPSPRALTPEAIAQEAAAVCPHVIPCPDVATALTSARAALPQDGLLVCCGSIPLVGAVRQFLHG